MLQIQVTFTIGLTGLFIKVLSFPPNTFCENGHQCKNKAALPKGIKKNDYKYGHLTV